MMWSLFPVMYYAAKSITSLFSDNMELYLYVNLRIACKKIIFQKFDVSGPLLRRDPLDSSKQTIILLFTSDH